MSRIVRAIPLGKQAGQLRRTRVLSATAEIVRECGYESLTVAQLASRAGVSTRAFNQLFDDPRECVSAAFEDAHRLQNESTGIIAAWKTTHTTRRVGRDVRPSRFDDWPIG